MPAQKPPQFRYDYPRPALTVDAVVATRDEPPRVLLIERKGGPFAGKWALPGGFVEENESLSDACRRELREETGVEVEELQQLLAAGDPGRDPRGWTVSVVYLARAARAGAKAGDDARRAEWFALDALPELAFDHAMILEAAKRRLT